MNTERTEGLSPETAARVAAIHARLAKLLGEAPNKRPAPSN